MKKNSTLLSDGQELIVNNHVPRVNDDPDPDSYRDHREATVNDKQSKVDHLQPADSKKDSGVNDDLALCNAVVSRESIVVSKEPSTENDPGVNTTINIRTRPNKNDPDPGRASGSFSGKSLVQLNSKIAGWFY